ncbi:MAG: hypothetical protein GYA55_14705 [SAR324 cluster bacterium]|uniref:ATP synthase subunit b n=1 Tax=SAR324 cluster bacterium TaxID=2024889 RepID=A0A7X9FU70_9DELT|nr:hypothetical protein [SAR324 cluster bacterium]
MKEFLKNFDLVPLDVPMILLGALLFFLFCKLFGKYVVSPYVRLVEIREAASEGAIEEAAADLRAAAELQRDFDLKISQARVQAKAEKTSVINAAKRDGAKLVDAADFQARQLLESERAALKQMVKDTQIALQEKEEALVSLVLKKFEVNDKSLGLN